MLALVTPAKRERRWQRKLPGEARIYDRFNLARLVGAVHMKSYRWLPFRREEAVLLAGVRGGDP